MGASQQQQQLSSLCLGSKTLASLYFIYVPSIYNIYSNRNTCQKRRCNRYSPLVSYHHTMML